MAEPHDQPKQIDTPQVGWWRRLHRWMRAHHMTLMTLPDTPHNIALGSAIGMFRSSWGPGGCFFFFSASAPSSPGGGGEQIPQKFRFRNGGPAITLPIMKFKAIALLSFITICVSGMLQAKTLKFPKENPQFS